MRSGDNSGGASASPTRSPMIRSQLSSLPVRREPDPAEGRRLARKAWHDHGLVMLRCEWLPTQLDRELLITLAVAVHGERGNG
jgi:hypothetical protein